MVGLLCLQDGPRSLGPQHCAATTHVSAPAASCCSAYVVTAACVAGENLPPSQAGGGGAGAGHAGAAGREPLAPPITAAAATINPMGMSHGGEHMHAQVASRRRGHDGARRHCNCPRNRLLPTPLQTKRHPTHYTTALSLTDDTNTLPSSEQEMRVVPSVYRSAVR